MFLLNVLIPVAIMTAGAGSNDAPGVPGPSCRPATLADLPDGEKVFLIDRLPLGATLEQLLALAPSLAEKPWGWEGEVTVFGSPARFHANVEGECVYNYYFNVFLPAALGDSLFALVDSLYTARWGPAVIGDGADSPYYQRGRSWCPDSLGVNVGCSIMGMSRDLGFGFQPICSHDGRRLNVPPCR
jgi:hypothetical protein